MELAKSSLGLEAIILYRTSALSWKRKGSDPKREHRFSAYKYYLLCVSSIFFQIYSTDNFIVGLGIEQWNTVSGSFPCYSRDLIPRTVCNLNSSQVRKVAANWVFTRLTMHAEVSCPIGKDKHLKPSFAILNQTHLGLIIIRYLIFTPHSFTH